MVFQQAQIPVQKAEEFEQLRSAIERAFAPAAVEKLLKRIQRSGVRVRELEKALDAGVFEAVSAVPAGKSAKQLYQALPLSGQALMREFYLERVEKVDAKLREKFQKVYRYY